MEYRRADDSVIVRLDPGDEIIGSLSLIIEKENIASGFVTGIGAVDQATIGIFKTADKQYLSKKFSGDHEIVSLTGTISSMDNKPYLHLHVALSNLELEMFGGHLNEARISAVSEIVINIINLVVGRKFNEKIGLNLLEF